MRSNQLLKETTDFYLSSEDFNGYPCHKIRCKHQISDDDLRPLLLELVEQGSGSLTFGDLHPNSSIRAFADEPIERQLQKVGNEPLDDACLYPTAKHLAKVVDKGKYECRPYTLELALGAGQLEFRAFDLSVLENYRNDPRYYYTNNDIQGNVCISVECYQSTEFPEKDKVILETFGFAYNDEFDRAVAVFLRYLSRLSPEHQMLWKLKEATGNYNLHPDYLKIVQGDWDWDFGISIFTAFLEELRIINEMCKHMTRPSLFREDFQEERPRNFAFLVRPTLEEYNSFVKTLDKMMSDNINKRFFKEEVSDKVETPRKDGKVEISNKGTIKMLEEWLNKKFKPSDRKPMEDLIAAFKEVRKKREKPAHAIEPNVFDQEYFHMQRQLIITAYCALRAIRLIFANHPNVRKASIDIPNSLDGKIWTQ